MKEENKNSPWVAIAPENSTLEPKALELARAFGLPMVSLEVINCPYLLIVTPERVVLKNRQIKNSKVMSVDFLSAKMRYRQSHQPCEWLKKAIGTSCSSSALIVDATAGFGEDAFILASQGYRVLMLERSAVLAALLTDGLARLYRSVTVASPLSLEFVHRDAKSYLPELAKSESIDIVYLDPMFPERKKSALSRKEMEALREIVGDDSDAIELLHTAFALAKNRVIVKRPRCAKPLGDVKPTFSIKGKLGRLDVYVVSN